MSTTRERAENSAGIFAEIVTKALYGGATEKARVHEPRRAAKVPAQDSLACGNLV